MCESLIVILIIKSYVFLCIINIHFQVVIMPKITPGESKQGKRKARPIDVRSEMFKKEDNAAMARCIQSSDLCFTPGMCICEPTVATNDKNAFETGDIKDVEVK